MLLAHGGIISPASSVRTVLVVSSRLLQLGTGKQFHLPGNVFKGRGPGAQFQRFASGEGLADVMRVKEALATETAVDEATDNVVLDDDEASKLKVRISIWCSWLHWMVTPAYRTILICFWDCETLSTVLTK